MIPDLKTAYAGGRLMLLLGAGASYGSTDSSNKPLPMGTDLAKEIAQLMGWPYADEPLGKVYSAANATNSAHLHSFFRSRLTNTRPSPAILKLSSFRWPRIYTLNIDDCFETAARISRAQKLQIFKRHSPLDEIDSIFDTVQLIKLNGCAQNPEDGFIFSPQEYGDGSNRLPIWYRELGNNYSNYTFAFVGSKLDEPLFQHALSEMRSTINRHPIRGYVITPTATEIDKRHLESLNLIHLPGAIDTLTAWLETEFPNPPSGWDLATARRPELQSLARGLSPALKRTLNSVTLVGDDTIPKISVESSSGQIRNFYKGYKPTWNDISENVHAQLATLRRFSEEVVTSHVGGKCIGLVGPAGSGKSTMLMSAALSASRSTTSSVYYLRDPVRNVRELVGSLSDINQNLFYIFIDKIEPMFEEIADILASPGGIGKACIVFSERLNIWNRRVKDTIEPHCSLVHQVGRITRNDAVIILERLEKYGAFTSLKPKTQEERVADIYSRADKQLLIGLLEATTGLGFTQIIRNDFASIGNDSHKKFLIMVGLASIHRANLSPAIVASALTNLEIAEDLNKLAGDTAGIVVNVSGKLSARHPVYVRELFEKIVPTQMIRDCIVAILHAFSDYEAPIIKNINKSDGVVFKSIMNHRFLKQILRNDADKVISIYSEFETKYHVDGFYWLQYGLSLRDFDMHSEALEKLKTARTAYSSPQVEHAYAQQLMIIAKSMDRWDDAEPLLNEAIEILRKLDHGADKSDSYPIVTLAEGHISVIVKFSGVNGAKLITQRYLKELLAANLKKPSQRLREAVEGLGALIDTGAWKEAIDDLDDDDI